MEQTRKSRRGMKFKKPEKFVWGNMEFLATVWGHRGYTNEALDERESHKPQATSQTV